LVADFFVEVAGGKETQDFLLSGREVLRLLRGRPDQMKVADHFPGDMAGDR
jgi:hypothetical protein